MRDSGEGIWEERGRGRKLEWGTWEVSAEVKGHDIDDDGCSGSGTGACGSGGGGIRARGGGGGGRGGNTWSCDGGDGGGGGGRSPSSILLEQPVEREFTSFFLQMIARVCGGGGSLPLL